MATTEEMNRVIEIETLIEKEGEMNRRNAKRLYQLYEQRARTYAEVYNYKYRFDEYEITRISGDHYGLKRKDNSENSVFAFDSYPAAFYHLCDRVVHNQDPFKWL